MKEIDSLYFAKKKELANREFKYFDGADENCQAFNNEQMWNMEQVNSFNGFSGLDSRSIRGFHNASGCGAGYNASGRSAGPVSVGLTNGTNERQIGNPVDCDGFECGNVEGHRLPVRCPNGCMCNNGSCVSEKGRLGEKPQLNRKSRRDSADRVSVAPVGGVGKQIGGTDCGGPCGHYHGISCNSQKGCRCSSTYNGTCESVYDKKSSTQANMNFSSYTNFVAPARRFSPAERVFPYGTGNYFSGGSARGCELDRR
tara:strand:- start:217 stop:984 length:768 start_codon:yes stop_codon:yes gene_type:complete